MTIFKLVKNASSSLKKDAPSIITNNHQDEEIPAIKCFKRYFLNFRA